MERMKETVEDATVFLEKLELLTPEKREHMRIVVKSLVDCYLRDDAHAIIVMSEDENPFGELLTINCNEMEAMRMLDQVHGLMQRVVMQDAPAKEMMN